MSLEEISEVTEVTEVPKIDFDKVLKTKLNEAKQTVGRAINNNVSFCCQLINVSTENSEGVHYPVHSEMAEWMKKLFLDTLSPKPLNEKALASMKAKGISPGKVPRELFLVIVSGSETHVNVGVSIPNTMSTENNIDDFVKCFMKDRNYEHETITDNIGKFVLTSYMCDSPLKERDVILQNVFNELKKRKIYVDDDDDDDVIYDLNENNDDYVNTGG